MLKAGVARIDVTPPTGLRMSGFAGRVFPSLAVHDPLWARAIVFDDGERRAGLVTMDLRGVSEETVAKVRGSTARSGIAPEGLLLAGTHTHSAPRFWDDGTLSEKEREYCQSLPEKLISVVGEAVSRLEPVKVGAVSGWSAIGINRREMVPGVPVTWAWDTDCRWLAMPAIASQ